MFASGCYNGKDIDDKICDNRYGSRVRVREDGWLRTGQRTIKRIKHAYALRCGVQQPGG